MTKGQGLKNDLDVAIQHLCEGCNKPLNGPDRGKVLLAVRLFGLKPGYRLCDCAQTIFDPKKNPVNWQGDKWQQVLSVNKPKIKVGH